MSVSPTFTRPDAVPSVMARLKSATAAAHARLDAAIDAERMTATRYAAVLRALARAHRLVEAALEPHARTLHRFDYDLTVRSKRAWLDDDLHDLHPDARVADDRHWRALTLPEGFGAVYVIEGATLGGRVVARALAAAPFLADGRGCRYFAGYGSATGDAWRRTSRSIESFHAWTSGAYTAEMVTGANATFSLFEREVGAELAALR